MSTEAKYRLSTVAFVLGMFSLILSIYVFTYCYLNINQTKEDIQNISNELQITKDDAQVYSENINKVVEIRVSDDNRDWEKATGCFISADGTILTNRHVAMKESVTPYRYIEVLLPQTEDNYVDAEFVRCSDKYDLAIIKIEQNNCEYFEIADSFEFGQETYIMGNPYGVGLVFGKGNISSMDYKAEYNGFAYTDMIMSDHISNSGNSGGPLFNIDGELVGVVACSLTAYDNAGNVNYKIYGITASVSYLSINEFLLEA